MKKALAHLIRDCVILAVSILAAYLLAHYGWIQNLLSHSRAFALPETILAGSLFTSVFTTPISLVLLGTLSQNQSLLFTATFGALGALLGDYIIFHFLRDYVAEDLKLVYHKLRRHRAHPRHASFFRKPAFQWIIPLFGAIIIASPLPDELGLAVLGLSKVKTSTMLVLTYSLNFIGILIIGVVARQAIF